MATSLAKAQKRVYRRRQPGAAPERQSKRLRDSSTPSLAILSVLSSSSDDLSSASWHSDDSWVSSVTDEGEEEGVHGRSASTALAVGLDPHTPTEEECRVLRQRLGVNVVPKATEFKYAKLRNHILVRWRRNVARYLDVEAALAGVAEPDRVLATLAWRFLALYGYINAGVSAPLCARMNAMTERSGSVIVVGAGCAGLAAARQLRMLGYRVVVVEARDRPGGRVHSMRLTGPNGAVGIAELGASIITGIDGNPAAYFTTQLGIPMSHIRPDTPLYTETGKPVDAELDDKVEKYHNFLLDQCSDVLRVELERKNTDTSLADGLATLWPKHIRENLGFDVEDDPVKLSAAQRLYQWHLANLEFANSALLSSISLRHWDQDDPNELPGPHTFVPGGNSRWICELAKGLPVFYSCPVREVCYGAEGVEVHTEVGRSFRADAVIVTVPLGVLKSGTISFQPPLTPRKQEAMERMNFGTLNKIALLFPNAFWASDMDMFGKVADEVRKRGENFLFYSADAVAGGAVLVALVAGEAALDHEERAAQDCVRGVMNVLRAIFEPRGIAVPAPLCAVSTRWGSDAYARGSYSSLAAGARGGEEYDTLAENLGGRVFFAGEATTKRYPATMHGALISGMHCAANVHACQQRLAKRISTSAPLLETKLNVDAVGSSAPGSRNISAGGAEAKQRVPKELSPRVKEMTSSVSFASGLYEKEEDQENLETRSNTPEFAPPSSPAKASIASEDLLQASGEPNTAAAAQQEPDDDDDDALSQWERDTNLLDGIFDLARDMQTWEFGIFSAIEGPERKALLSVTVASSTLVFIVPTAEVESMADLETDRARFVHLARLPHVRFGRRQGWTDQERAWLKSLRGILQKVRDTRTDQSATS